MGILGDLENIRDAGYERLAAKLEQKAENQTQDKPDIALLRKQQKVIDRIVNDPKPRAVVLAVKSPKSDEQENVVAVVSYQGMQLEVVVSKEMNVQPGNEVSLLNATLQPIEVVDNPLGIGDIAVVSRVISETASEVLFRGAKRMVLNGASVEGIEVGDRVVVDNSCMIIMKNLGKSGNEFEFRGKSNFSWDKIIGCVAAKEKIKDAIETPYLRSDVFGHYHDEPPKGIMLIGGPGCGKTLLLKASISAHQAIHGAKAFVLYISGAELLRGIVGDTEELIRQLFAYARAHFHKTEVRALLVIDEVEALLAKRGTGKSSDVEKTNVATFLAEMNGVDSTGNPTLLFATNRPDVVDDAIMRDERMDEIIVIPPPTREEAPAFFNLYLQDVPLAEPLEDIVTFATNEFFSDEYTLATVKRKSTNSEEHFTLGHVVNGAMLRGVVRRAKGIARRRDLQETKQGEALGSVRKADIKDGVRDAFEKKSSPRLSQSIVEICKGIWR